jgi:hypothetical protein
MGKLYSPPGRLNTCAEKADNKYLNLNTDPEFVQTKTDMKTSGTE